MPSLIDMRRPIRAVKSTQQITKAMKMVAASKLRRAQERVVQTRPFAREARRVLESVAGRVDQTTHPLLTRRPGVETGATPETNAADNIKSLAMVFAAIESAAQRRPVAVTW